MQSETHTKRLSISISKRGRSFIMKKIISVVFVFCVFVCLLSLTLFSDKTSDRISVRENRPLANLPSARFFSSDYKNQLSDWLGDSIFIRDFLIDLRTKINENIFHVKPVHYDVSYGKEGWLFYRPQNNIEIAMGTYPLTESHIKKIADNQQKISDYYKKHGKTYIFAVHPSKVSIYPEYLMGNYTIRETPCDMVTDYLRKHTDVLVCDMKSELLKHKNEGLLYWKDDTHWTPLGDYYAYKAIVDTLKIDDKFESTERIEKSSLESSFGDLCTMAGIKRTSYPFTDLVLNFSTTKNESDITEKLSGIYKSDFVQSRDPANHFFVLENDTCQQKTNLLVYADSQFCAGPKKLSGLLGENFYRSVFVWSKEEQSTKLADALNCDYVLYSISERFLYNDSVALYPSGLIEE